MLRCSNIFLRPYKFAPSNLKYITINILPFYVTLWYKIFTLAAVHCVARVVVKQYNGMIHLLIGNLRLEWTIETPGRYYKE
jgi:hypothetical protein